MGGFGNSNSGRTQPINSRQVNAPIGTNTETGAKLPAQTNFKPRKTPIIDIPAKKLTMPPPVLAKPAELNKPATTIGGMINPEVPMVSPQPANPAPVQGGPVAPPPSMPAVQPVNPYARRQMPLPAIQPVNPMPGRTERMEPQPGNESSQTPINKELILQILKNMADQKGPSSGQA
jgi:hypothetical protein